MGKLVPIPGLEKPRFYKTNWFEAVLSGVPPIIAAVLGAYNADRIGLPAWLVWVFLGIALWSAAAMAVKIMAAQKKDAESNPERVHDGLRAATILLHAATAQICGLDSDLGKAHLRVTFHRVVPPLDKAKEIEQVVPYAGGRENGSGRRSLLNVGITGAAIREDEPFLLSSSGTEAQLRAELVKTYGYTPDQVLKLTPGRVSAMAVPVYDIGRRETLGVLYLDSDLPAIFDDQDTYQAILAVCDGFSRYVSERY